MPRTSRSEWAKRVQRWGESGLTAKEFAAETGLKASTLSYWKWRLGSGQVARGSHRATAKSAEPRRPERAHASGPTFMEVTPVPPTAAVPLELVLRDALTVRVPVGFDEDTLSRVLRLVGAAR